MNRPISRRDYAALAVALILALALVWFCQPAQAAENTQSANPEIVARLEARYGLPGALDRAWARECSRQEIGDSKWCRNHGVSRRSVGERGSFQMTRSAAEHSWTRCDYRRLGRPGEFAYEAECAARYLLYWTIRCGSQHRGEIAYVRGFCTSTYKRLASR